MSVRLGCWGRSVNAAGVKTVIPSNPTLTPGAPWLYDFLCAQMPDLAKHFDGFQLPPASKAQGGAGAGCDGYGVFDLRDIGSKNQQGSIETHYGSKQSLLRLVAMAHRYGMSVFGDIPLHQMFGDNERAPGIFQYLGADGKTLNGRGATAPGWFDGEQDWNTTTKTWNDPIPPFVKHDSVPGYDPAFGGRERSNQNSSPAGVVIADSLDFGDWFFRTTGIDGARFDDAKGTWPNFVAQFMQSRAMARKTFYSEFFDSPANAGGWATSYPMEGRSGVEDFGTHFAIQVACNSSNTWAMKDGGYFNWRPDLSWPFVDNPDTDTSPGQQVIWSKLLGYAYLLTIPCAGATVYGKDYFPSSVWPGAYGLKPWIDQMLWASRVLALGAYSVPYCDGTAIVLQRNGQGGSFGSSPGLLTAISFDQSAGRTVTVPTIFWPGTHLHDFLGHHGDIWCDGEGNATFMVPPNTGGAGQNALMFSWVGMEGYVIEVSSGTAVQEIEAAADLDVAPIPAGSTAPCGLPIYADIDTDIAITLQEPADITLITITGPDGNPLDGEDNLFRVAVAGWHQISATNTGAVDAPYVIEVQYTAPKEVITA